MSMDQNANENVDFSAAILTGEAMTPRDSFGNATNLKNASVK